MSDCNDFGEVEFQPENWTDTEKLRYQFNKTIIAKELLQNEVDRLHTRYKTDINRYEKMIMKYYELIKSNERMQNRIFEEICSINNFIKNYIEVKSDGKKDKK
jgi:signal transduction protein with GAF and PtsI domain